MGLLVILGVQNLDTTEPNQEGLHVPIYLCSWCGYYILAICRSFHGDFPAILDCNLELCTEILFPLNCFCHTDKTNKQIPPLQKK